jgi:hypothetical protein
LSRYQIGENLADWQPLSLSRRRGRRVSGAIEAGASVIKEPTNMFYGDRRATVQDPYGNIWQIATHKGDLTLEEIRKRNPAAARQ